MTIKVVHIHKIEGADEETFCILNKKLDFIIEKLHLIMTKQERFDAILTSLNETTNEIAADYQALLDQINNDSVSDESLAKAEENIAKLKQIAASNDQPVPGTDIPPVTGEPTV